MSWSRLLAWTVIAIAVLVLAGWFLNIELLSRPIPGLVAMNPVTSVCFILSCSSFLIIIGKASREKSKVIAYSLLCIVMIVGLLKLSGLLFQWNWQIDRILFADKIRMNKLPASLAASTAICFFLTGLSMIWLSSRRIVAQVIAIVIFLLTMFALLGYIYKIPEFISMLPFLSMAVHTIICFILLSVAILFAYPSQGLMRELTSDKSGSLAAGKLIPFALTIPIILGLLRLVGHWSGWFTTELGVALLVTSIILMFLSIIWYCTVLLNKRDSVKSSTEKKFELLLEAAPDAMIIANDKGRIILINKQTEKLFGYTRNELIGQPVEILIPGHFHKNHVSHREKYVGDPKVRSMGAGLELFAKRKDNTQFPVEISLSPLHTEEGLLVSASVRDITDRKKAEQKFRALLDAAPDATVIVDAKGIIQMVNHQTENLFGYSREEIIGKEVEILIPPELKNKHVHHRSDFAKSANVRSMGAGIELNAVKKNGLRFPVEISLSPIQTEEGMLVSAAVRDISDRKKMETDLKQSNEELEAFTYSVSHDLRAPLRGIIGFTNILEEDYASKLDDEARRITSIIKNNTLKMGHLVDDLLAFFRMGKRELIKTKVGMEKMVKEVIGEMEQQNPSVQRVHWDLLNLPDTKADLNTIRQVWVNLISNAVKYSANTKTPAVKIGSYHENGQAIFYVKDNGVGFSEQYKHKLFKVFQRLHSTEEFEGSGVGLALTEKIVSRHGGKVWAEGKEGEGACFYFSLPHP